MLYLMWMDCSSDPLETRLQRAAAHFERKLGRKPKKVLVPKGTGTAGAQGLILRESRLVDKGHLWLA